MAISDDAAEEAHGPMPFHIARWHMRWRTGTHWHTLAHTACFFAETADIAAAAGIARRPGTSHALPRSTRSAAYTATTCAN
jgi:hypothetical protein